MYHTVSQRAWCTAHIHRADEVKTREFEGAILPPRWSTVLSGCQWFTHSRILDVDTTRNAIVSFTPLFTPCNQQCDAHRQTLTQKNLKLTGYR